MEITPKPGEVFRQRQRAAHRDQDIGGLHQSAVNGSACAFHHRIQVLSSGSPRSCGTRAERCAASGHVQATARSEEGAEGTRGADVRRWQMACQLTDG